MVGVIRKRDIVAHPVVTVRCFGWPVFLKALVAGRQQTFLSLLVEASALHPPRIEVPELIERCIGLELQASRIYERLAEHYAKQRALREFFENLADQEREHAELLGLSRECAAREGWQEKAFTPWRDAIPRLEYGMDAAEASAQDLDDLSEVLRLVIEMESSEINQVFDSVVAATDSDFVRRLSAFHAAGAEHIDYIMEKIQGFRPELGGECAELRAACFPRAERA
ncbi:MAG TPA: ferritin family protein [Gemmatimonadota bacterium]|nr:ferritin family protein [Gemmatimonadota bacterium]